MAQLSIEEFEQCLETLTTDSSVGSLRDRFVRIGAFHTRKGIATLSQLAQRLWTLSSGLKRPTPALHGFQALWADWLGSKLDDGTGHLLDEIANAINEALDGNEIRDAMRDALEERLSRYESVLAARVGPIAARLDTLQKALPVVAELLRGRALPEPATDLPEPTDEHVHGAGCEHGHGDDEHVHGADCDHGQDDDEKNPG